MNDPLKFRCPVCDAKPLAACVNVAGFPEVPHEARERRANLQLNDKENKARHALREAAVALEQARIQCSEAGLAQMMRMVATYGSILEITARDFENFVAIGDA